MNIYKDGFYENRHQITLYAAETILSHVHNLLPNFNSAIDLGCGVGTWLYVMKQKGASKVCGVDGSWVNRDYLQISENEFIEHDLSKNINIKIPSTFDLAISLEVAEHLPEKSAHDFVNLLTNLSDFVLFSAAIPYQGGLGHVNEQWPSYWISFFENYGYIGLDIIRKNVWDDQNIPLHYRQNTLLYVKKERIKDLNLKKQINDHIPPEAYLIYLNKLIKPGIKQSYINLISAIKRRTKETFYKNE